MALSFFNANYLVSVISGLTAGFLMNKANPQSNPYVKFFLLPLLVAYVVLKTFNALFPSFGVMARDVSNYVEDRSLSHINSMGFFEVYPVLFAVLIIFVILLYGGHIN